MNNYRAHYFPTFGFKPKSIKDTLRFGNPFETIGSIILFVIWLAGVTVGYAICGVLYVIRLAIWVITKIGGLAFGITIGGFVSVCFAIMVILMLIGM